MGNRPGLVFGPAAAVILASAAAVFASGYPLFFLAATAILLLVSHLAYTRIVEGRPLPRLLAYSAFLWLAAGTMEAAGLRSGLYTYKPTPLADLHLGPVPLYVPTVWVLLCWLAESVSESLFAVDRRLPGSRAVRCLASAWILLSFGLAMEWQLSDRLGLWTWSAALPGPRLDGVPIYNFFVWFAFGMAAPWLADLFRVPAIRYGVASPTVRALPLIGFGTVLFGGAAMNFGHGLPAAGAAALASGLFLAAVLAGRRRPAADG